MKKCIVNAQTDKVPAGYEVLRELIGDLDMVKILSPKYRHEIYL